MGKTGGGRGTNQHKVKGRSIAQDGTVGGATQQTPSLDLATAPAPTGLVLTEIGDTVQVEIKSQASPHGTAANYGTVRPLGNGDFAWHVASGQSGVSSSQAHAVESAVKAIRERTAPGAESDEPVFCASDIGYNAACGDDAVEYLDGAWLCGRHVAGYEALERAERQMAQYEAEAVARGENPYCTCEFAGRNGCSCPRPA